MVAVPLIVLSCFFIGWRLGGGLGTMTGGSMIATHWTVGQSALLVAAPLAAIAIVVTMSGNLFPLAGRQVG